MTIDEWKNLYEILDNQHSTFLSEYQTMRSGKNKKIREGAERKVDNSIELSCSWILRYEEAYRLLTGGDENSDFSRTITWEEFVRANYFGSDMSEFLRKIRRKIASIEE